LQQRLFKCSKLVSLVWRRIERKVSSLCLCTLEVCTALPAKCLHVLFPEYYLARPFNFNLSPLFYLDNKIKDRFPERKIVFSSSAADFLQGEGFSIGKVFSEGVFYLSHAEEEETRERFRQRSEREKKKSDVVIPPSDTRALEFYRNARKTIAAWVNSTKVQYHPPLMCHSDHLLTFVIFKPEQDFVNIGDAQGGDLNGYQRLLVHQLVKNEFPGYRSFARNRQSFVQVEKIDPKKDAEVGERPISLIFIMFRHMASQEKLGLGFDLASS
jgi:poly(A)-specific ribonuclease